MTRFLSGSAALLLIAVTVLAGACGERVTPIPTTPGQAPGEVPFSVSSPSAVASSTAVPTRAPIRPREARPLNTVELMEALNLVLYERPDVNADPGLDAFIAPGLEQIRLTADPNNAAFLVDMLAIPPYGAIYRRHIGDALQDLTGQRTIGTDWFEWLTWLEAHPELEPPAAYFWWKGELLSTVDPRFREFFPENGAPHAIRLEEIAWGGVAAFDGIPSLDNPEVVAAHNARYLDHDEQVFGVFLNGEARAYPLRIMNWHEMTNDVVGGQPFALAYCTLCGSGILFDTRRGDGQEPYRFGSSGLLYRSNKLMYDSDTNSLWNQFTGRPVVGELVGENIELPILPVMLTTWGEWNRQHPSTTVLSLNTGHDRPYEKPGTPGAAYFDYFSSPSLMFPNGSGANDGRLLPKSQVFVAVLDGGESKAYPLELLGESAVINDAVSDVPVVLVTDAGGGVQAFLRENRTYTLAADGGLIDEQGQAWRVTPDGLSGPSGELALRVSGHVAFWFGYASFRPDGELYTGG